MHINHQCKFKTECIRRGNSTDSNSTDSNSNPNKSGRRIRLVCATTASETTLAFSMKSTGASLPLFWVLSYAILGNALLAAHLSVKADMPDNESHYHDEATCDEYGVCQQTEEEEETIPTTLKESEICRRSSQHDQHYLSSSMRDFYRCGISAQAYKPNAPVKTSVCEVQPTNTGDISNPLHSVAHWSFWRSNYKEVVPIVVHANVYSCGLPAVSPSNDGIKLEVWQPRPDGTFSSLHSGMEEGDCRASVTAITGIESEWSNLLGQVQYETLAPGSTGLLGGLVPDSSREYPPYGPASINMFLNVEGYNPSLVQLNMNELDKFMLQKDSDGRFRFNGWDLRPHASKTTKYDVADGIQIQSVKKISRPGFNLALEVEVDLFLVAASGNEEEGSAAEQTDSHVFCSYSDGYFNSMSSFFKEPITLCSPSMLDFFAL
mmetsp:Transcript_208/g.397  ORF Transcript_208/g.397 Transcript_208/m.397 type:complete len:434 (+) Transcript_208:22-1323(+)